MIIGTLPCSRVTSYIASQSYTAIFGTIISDDTTSGFVDPKSVSGTKSAVPEKKNVQTIATRVWVLLCNFRQYCAGGYTTTHYQVCATAYICTSIMLVLSRLFTSLVFQHHDALVSDSAATKYGPLA